MLEHDDWRLTGQDKYLTCAGFLRRKYKVPSADWDHDHCEFCWTKFMEGEGADVLHEGYVTIDGRHWVCPQCFSDFREMFEFTE